MSSVSICALLIAIGICGGGFNDNAAGIVSSAHAFGGGSRMPQPPPNYEGKQFYKVLGVNADAKPEEIRRQFRRLAKKHHPDMQGQHGKTPLTDAQTKANSEKFKTITEAYQVLSDKDKRKEYDLYRKDPSSHQWGRGGPPPSGFPNDFGFPPGFEDDFMGGGHPGGGGGKQRQGGGNDPSGMPNSFDEFLRREFGDSFFSNFNGEEDDNFMQDEADMEKYTRDGGEGSERNLFRDASRRKRDRETKQRTRTRDAMKETLKKMGAGGTSGSSPNSDEDGLEDTVPGLKVPTGVDPEKLFTLRGGSASQGPGAPRHGPAVPPPKKQKSKRPNAASNSKDASGGGSWFGGLFGADGEAPGRKKAAAPEAPESDDPLSYYAATEEELIKSQQSQDRIKWAQRKAFATKHATSSEGSNDGNAADEEDEEIDPSEMSDEEVDMVMAELAIREAKDDAEINSNIYTTSEEKAVLRKIKTAERERKIKRLRGVIMAKQKVLEEQESAIFRQQQAARAAKSAEERKRAREETFDRTKMFGAAPPSPDDLFEEVLQEDMYGHQRLVRRRKKKRSARPTHDGDVEVSSTSGGGGLDEDPLESTYSEHIDDTPMGSQFGKNKKATPKDEEEEDATNFIVPDATKAKKQAAADEAVGEPTATPGSESPDYDPLDHLNSKDDNIPKPRSQKEKNMMKWAYEMAKKMGTRAPMGVDPTKAGKMSAKEAAEYMAKSGIDPLTGEKLRPGQKPSMPSASSPPPSGSGAKKKNSKTKKTDTSGKKQKKDQPSSTSSKTTPKKAQQQPPTDIKKAQKQGSGAGHRGTLNFGQKPDMNVKPTAEQMAAMEKLFGDPKKAGLKPEEVIKSEHVDPETYTKIFKSGRPPTEDELRDINGDLNGGTKDTVSAATRAHPSTPKKAPTPKKKAQRKEDTKSEDEEDNQLTVENFESYCGGGASSIEDDREDDEGHTIKPTAKKACVVLMSSATSLPALIRTADPTAKRYPVSTKTFYVTRPNVEAISSFLFERVRVAHRQAGRPEPPIEFKEAMCRTYRVSTTSNAGEICAVVIRDGGLGVQIVGRQRLENYDIPAHLKSKLNSVVDGAIAPPVGGSGGGSARVGANKGGVVPNSIVRGKDVEALVYLPIKRGTFQWIDEFGSP